MKTLIASIAILASTSAMATVDLSAWLEENGYFAAAACTVQKEETKVTNCVADLMTNGYFEEAFALAAKD